MIVLMQSTVNLLVSNGINVETIKVDDIKKLNDQSYFILNEDDYKPFKI
jgi:hypothetical protein